MDNEKWFDEKIAPMLLYIAKECQHQGIPFVSVAEYSPGERCRTATIPKNAGLAMVMLNLLAQVGENVDGFIIGMKRYAAKNNIDTSASIYLSDNFGPPLPK